MPAPNVPIDVEQGADWTADVIWTDMFDEPVNVIHPCRMDVKSAAGQTVLTLETDPDIPEGEIPSMNLSADIGLIQFHLAKEQTLALLPGTYLYDLFVTCDDDNEYSGTQVTRLMYGQFNVYKTLTRM